MKLNLLLFSLFILFLTINKTSGQASNFKSPLDTIIVNNHFVLNYDDKKVLEGDLINGRRENKWTWYDPNGVVRIEGNYHDGEKNGEWKYFYKNNAPASLMTYANGKPAGKSVGFDSTGKRLNEKFYNESYEQDSLYTSFYPNQKKQFVLRYQDGNIRDAVAAYDSSGNILDPGTLRNGNGTVRYYLSNGKLSSIEHYKSSILAGDYIEYYSNGNVAAKGFYAGDTASGVWQYFSLNGEPKVRVNYDLDTSKIYNFTDSDPDGIAFQYYEVMPEFPGGTPGLMRFLNKNLRYPAAARENGIEGRVVTQFVVNEIGEIEDPTVVQDIGGGCSEEVLRLLKYMPPWTPGMQNGTPVKVYFKLPTTFKLGKEKTKKDKKKK